MHSSHSNLGKLTSTDITGEGGSTHHIIKTCTHCFRDAAFSMLLRLRKVFISTATMKVDPAIIELLGLDPAKTSTASSGGSGFASTSKITTTLEDGTQKKFFMKSGTGKDADVMFEGMKCCQKVSHHFIIALSQAF